MAVNGTGGISYQQIYGLRNKGIGGLASGLDTDSLVESLIAGTKNKIIKQSQDRQLLNWKMSAYRGVASTLKAFQDKYLKYGTASATTNLMSPSFFNTFKATSSSTAVSVKASSVSVPQDIEIKKILQLASAEKLNIKDNLQSKIVSNLTESDLATESFAGKKLNLEVNGVDREINLDTLDNFTDADERKEELQRLITNAFGSVATSSGREPIVKIGTTDGTPNGYLTLTSASAHIKVWADPDEFDIDDPANQPPLGFANGSTNRFNMTTKIGDIATFSGLSGEIFKFKLNGVEISISKNETLRDLKNKIDSSAANVRLEYNQSTGAMSLISKKTGDGENIILSDTQGNFMSTLFGVASGSAIGSKYLTTGNASAAGTAMGDLDLLTDAKRKELFKYIDSLEFELTINGVTKTVKANYDGLTASDKKNDTVSNQGLVDALNAGIKKAFGADTTVQFKYARDGVVLQSVDKNGNPANDSFTAKVSTKNNDNPIESERTPNPESFFNALQYLGFSGTEIGNTVTTTGAIGTDTTLGALSGGVGTGGTLTILDENNNPLEVDYDEDDSIEDLIRNINSTFAGYAKAEFKNGQIIITGENGKLNISDDGDLLNNLYGIKKPAGGPAVYETQAASDVDRVAGQNAEIELADGTIRYSTTNTFDFDGTDVTVESVTDGTVPIRISVKSDPTEVVDKLKTWIDDYNALVKTLTGMVNEEKVKDYPPLTDEQKSQMTQDQIKNWESEAQKGILRSDSTLRGILAEMRATLYETVESAGIALYDIGITTKDYTQPGQIELTAKGEEMLREMLQTNPDKVRLLFQDPDKGLAVKMNTIIDRAANPSSVNRGSLITLAGTELPTGDNTSTLGNKIDAIDKYITTLRKRLETEYNFYWKKFSALETAIQRMQTQSGWLQDFGGQ